MPKLELYLMYNCPFCLRVLQKIEELSLDITFFDITQDSSALEKLVQDTGRRTVPCLYIDDKPMHESADIINWLDQNQSKIKKK